MFLKKVEAALKKLDLKPSTSDLKLIVNAVSWRVEDAPRVIAKQEKLKPGQSVTEHDRLCGWFEIQNPQSKIRIRYEADTKIGYEVSFTRHFYQPPQLRTLAQIIADILALEQETEGLLHAITKGVTA